VAGMSRKRKKPLHQHSAEWRGFKSTALIIFIKSIPLGAKWKNVTTGDQLFKNLECSPKLDKFQSGIPLEKAVKSPKGVKKGRIIESFEMLSQKLLRWLSKNFVLQGLVVFQGRRHILSMSRS
jgi:hypothetical protein